MARAMWKASLELGPEKLPVKLYAAVEDRSVHFRLLHRADRKPVRQRMVHPGTGEEVPSDEIRRGVEIEPGVFVTLAPKELESAEPRPSRSIEVLRFVPCSAVDVGWYERPYLLGPDGSSADYFALAAALRESGRCGIARWVMRGRQYAGALEPRGAHLALIALRDPSEVVPGEQLAPPEGGEIRPGERKLAEQLVAALDAPFDPQAVRDEYRERVHALIEAKSKGRTYKVSEPRAPRAGGDLADALRRSLKAAKGRRSAA